jgi:hypothetical protein
MCYSITLERTALTGSVSGWRLYWGGIQSNRCCVQGVSPSGILRRHLSLYSVWFLDLGRCQSSSALDGEVDTLGEGSLL